MSTWLRDGGSSDVQYAICLSLALFDPESFPRPSREEVVARLRELQANTSDSGVRAAAEIARRTWDPRAPEDAPPTKHFVLNKSANLDGLPLIKISAGRYLLGRINQDVLHDDHQPHWVTLTRDYWVADREVSIQWYQAFLADDQYPAERKPLPDQRQAPEQATSPTTAHPVQRVSWNDAAMFCNWLSWRESLRPRYVFSRIESKDDSIASPDRETTPAENLTRHETTISREWLVAIDPASDGYRLPTLAEWEVACRAGSESEFFYGDDFDLFGYYGRFSSARVVPTAPCGSLFPNRYGLHETLGNVWEWCEDWYEPIGSQPLTDPIGPPEPLAGFVGRTFAGGGVQTSSGEPIAGSRGFASVDSRFANLGFRIARSVSRGPEAGPTPSPSATAPNSPK
jgi:formylglycine-generating enzyme required for sulfatase activity